VNYLSRFAFLIAAATAIAAACAGNATAQSPMPTKAPPPSSVPAAPDWTGFYIGGHIGYGWGNSNWSTPPGISGSFSVAKPFDPFADTGSVYMGVQAGYDYMLPNRFVVGAVADASFPSWPNLGGISIGGVSPLTTPALGGESFSETMLDFGTVRGRIGYAPGNWLVYATGGFAWAYDQITVTQQTTGVTQAPFLWRFGWTAGAGVELPIMPNWTAKAEYLYVMMPNGSFSIPSTPATTGSVKFQENVIRAGVNFKFVL